MESQKDAAILLYHPHTLIVPDSLSAALNKTTFSIMYLCASTGATTGTDLLVLKFEGKIKNLMTHHHEKRLFGDDQLCRNM